MSRPDGYGIRDGSSARLQLTLEPTELQPRDESARLASRGLGAAASHISRGDGYTRCGLLITGRALQANVVVQRPGLPYPLPGCRRCQELA